jgi:REP element-mobilizing transposase RayT
VTSRALEGTALFKDARDYETYLALLKAYQERFGFKLFAFVLLPDHLHLCLELPNGITISAIMHALNSRYTKYVTKRYGRIGHLLQDRFKLTVIEKAPSLLRVTGYLHTHPLLSRVADGLGGYRWSSYATYLAAQGTGIRYQMVSDTGPTSGEVAEVLEALSHEHPGLTYEQYLLSMTEPEWKALRTELQERVVGSETFVAEVERRLKVLPSLAAEPTRPVVPRGTGDPGPMPQPRPTRPGPSERPARAGLLRRPRLAVTMSVAMASISLLAAVLYARNVAFLRETVGVLATEIQSVSFAMKIAGSGASAVRLATLNRPQDLRGTSWDVRMRPMYASEHGLTQADQLRFDERKVASATLSAEGFAASPYTVRLEGDGVIVWETVQVGPNGQAIFWRGQRHSDVMTGRVSRQGAAGAQEEFSFIGILRESEQGTSET